MRFQTVWLFVILISFFSRNCAQASVKNVVLKVMFVIEHDLYKRWYEYSGNDMEKTTDAINYFYSKVFTLAREQLRKESNDKVTFDLVFYDSILDKTGKELPFVSSHVANNLIGFGVIKHFRDYLNEKMKEMHSYHVAFLFTKYSFHWFPDVKALSFETLDHYRSSAVVVVEGGLYETVNFVVEWTARALARLEQTCPALKDVGKSELKGLSDCLKRKVEDRVRYINPETALVDYIVTTPGCSKMDVYPSSKQPSLSADQQCKLLYGPESNSCDTPDQDICKALGCSKDGQCHHYSDNKAFPGTACGQGGTCGSTRCICA